MARGLEFTPRKTTTMTHDIHDNTAMPTARAVPGTAEHSRTRRRQWGCIFALLGMIVLLLLTTAYLCLFRSVPLRISKETTYITEPLKSNGNEVDYFAAWEKVGYPVGMATEENGFRLIIQHLGASADTPPGLFDQLCKKLGLAADSIQPDMTLQEPSDFLADYVESEEFDESIIDRLLDEGRSDEADPAEEDSSDTNPVTEEFGEDEMIYGMGMGGEYVPNALTVLDQRHGRPWTLDDLPMMEGWLTQNAPALTLMGEAVQKPQFYIPLLRDSQDEQFVDSSQHEWHRIRAFARALYTRAQFHVANGNIDAAIEDILTGKRLGRHLQRVDRLPSKWMGAVIEGMADAVGIAGSLDHPPNKEQLTRFVGLLNDLPPKGRFQQSLPFERYQALDTVQAMAQGRLAIDDCVDAIRLSSRLRYDWTLFAARVNEHYETYITTGGLPWPKPTPRAIFTLRSRTRMMADEFAFSVLHALDAAQETGGRQTCFERIRRIALAMLFYECDHGILPPAYSSDADGNPLHSWRVLLLPYLGQQRLYDKIRLDQPWDSPHNKQFHEEAIAFYQCPSAELAPGQTTYSVVVGPDTAFQGSEGKTLASFGPNSATMILVVERYEPACWMDPNQNIPQAHAEVGINMKKGDYVGSQHTVGAGFGLRDGAVRFLSQDCDVEFFRGLLHGTSNELP